VTLPVDDSLDLVLADGRGVRVAQYGDPAGDPVLWLHGGGSSRLEGAVLHAAAVEQGLRVLAPDRPGVGGSDPHPGRTVAGYASDDAEQVLDLLGIERVRVGGLSNGGMYAMSVASGLPDRVLQVVPVNPAVPIADPAVRASVTRTTRLAYAFLSKHPERASRGLTSPASPGLLVRLLERLFKNPDAEVMAQPGPVAMLAALRAEAVRQPDRSGLLDEVRLGPGGWGFDHRAVAPPVTFLVGEQDRSLGYVRTWAAELPQGRLVVAPGGHMNVYAGSVARRACELLRGQH
jgi:pimeloyl-ACP methyl ester carboxylesterase